MRPQKSKKVLPILGWVLLLFSLICIFNNSYTMNTYRMLYVVLFVTSAVLLSISAYKARTILTTALHVSGAICGALWALPLIGIIDPMFIILSLMVTIIGGVLLVATAINLFFVRLKAGAAGYGWNEGSDWYSQRKKKW